MDLFAILSSVILMISFSCFVKSSFGNGFLRFISMYPLSATPLICFVHLQKISITETSFMKRAKKVFKKIRLGKEYEGYIWSNGGENSYYCSPFHDDSSLCTHNSVIILKKLSNHFLVERKEEREKHTFRRFPNNEFEFSNYKNEVIELDQITTLNDSADQDSKPILIKDFSIGDFKVSICYNVKIKSLLLVILRKDKNYFRYEVGNVQPASFWELIRFFTKIDSEKRLCCYCAAHVNHKTKNSCFKLIKKCLGLLSSDDDCFIQHSLSLKESAEMIVNGYTMFEEVLPKGRNIFEGYMKDLKENSELKLSCKREQVERVFGELNFKLLNSFLERNYGFKENYNKILEMTYRLLIDRIDPLPFIKKKVLKNWEFKRFLSDISYFSESTGNCSVKFADHKINPREKCIKFFKGKCEMTKVKIINNNKKQEYRCLNNIFKCEQMTNFGALTKIEDQKEREEQLKINKDLSRLKDWNIFGLTQTKHIDDVASILRKIDSAERRISKRREEERKEEKKRDEKNEERMKEVKGKVEYFPIKGGNIKNGSRTNSHKIDFKSINTRNCPKIPIVQTEFYTTGDNKKLSYSDILKKKITFNDEKNNENLINHMKKEIEIAEEIKNLNNEKIKKYKAIRGEFNSEKITSKDSVNLIAGTLKKDKRRGFHSGKRINGGDFKIELKNSFEIFSSFEKKLKGESYTKFERMIQNIKKFESVQNCANNVGIPQMLLQLNRKVSKYWSKKNSKNVGFVENQLEMLKNKKKKSESDKKDEFESELAIKLEDGGIAEAAIGAEDSRKVLEEEVKDEEGEKAVKAEMEANDENVIVEDPFFPGNIEEYKREFVKKKKVFVVRGRSYTLKKILENIRNKCTKELQLAFEHKFAEDIVENEKNKNKNKTKGDSDMWSQYDLDNPDIF